MVCIYEGYVYGHISDYPYIVTCILRMFFLYALSFVCTTCHNKCQGSSRAI